MCLSLISQVGWEFKRHDDLQLKVSQNGKATLGHLRPYGISRCSRTVRKGFVFLQGVAPNAFPMLKCIRKAAVLCFAEELPR